MTVALKFSSVAKGQQVQSHYPQLQGPRKQQHAWPMDWRDLEGGGSQHLWQGMGVLCHHHREDSRPRKERAWVGGTQACLFSSAVFETTRTLQLMETSE